LAASVRLKEEEAVIEKLKGANVFIRTVTHHFTGRLAAVEGGFAQLDDAAWIADDGRFADALAEGKLAEVEPYPGTCYVSLGSIVDVSEWLHDLPREQV
jgi:hypothetical protein